MAIKISGNTVIDDSQNITATGSATFSGPISLGSVALPSAGTARIYSRDTDNSLYMQTSSGNRISLLDGSQNSMASFEPTVLKFFISNTPQMQIDSSGRLLLGTTTEGQQNADNLTIADSGHCGLTIRSGTTSGGAIYFSDATSGGGEYEGYIEYNHPSRFMRFGVAQDEAMRLDSSGDITATGSATFAGSISAGVGSFSGNVTVNRTGSSQVILEGQLSGSQTSQILADGSATFAGETIVKGDLLKRTAAGATVVALRDDYLRVYNNPVSYDDYKISLEKDGSATFAGTLNTKQQIVIDNEYGDASTDALTTGLALRSGDGSTLTTRINYNGNATFGPLNTSSSTGYGAQVDMAANAATVKAQCQQTANSGTLLFAGYMGANRYFHVTADGTASFNGTITAAGYSLANLNPLP